MKNSPTPAELLPLAIRTAQAAGAEILAVYRDPNFEATIEQKGDNSPLTLADRRAHVLIAKELEKHSPEIPLLSEEGKHLDFSVRKNWNRFWLVDPLDGTKEFIKRNGEFAVHIALVENGVATLGVVHLPVLGVTYFAVQNGGAFKLENGQQSPVRAAQFTENQEGLVVVASRSHLSPETSEFIARFKNAQTVSMGSSMKFMLVADGRAHVYPRLGPTMEWDSAAPQVIVEEAGGSVIDQQTGLPLCYNKENLLNHWFVVRGNVQG